MKKGFLLFLVLTLSFLPVSWAGGYFENAGHDLVRGFKNVVSAPAEIFLGIQKEHKSSQLPVLREAEGFLAGTINMIERAGCGLWDFVVFWAPGDQEGLVLNPETLF